MEDNSIEFYINKFSFLTNKDMINIDFIPSLLKRRMSLLDKTCAHLLNETSSEDIQNIIYSSQFGEMDCLNKMIEQYSKDKEVSPSLFSASVHNYPIGFFLFNTKKAIPYNALSSMDNTISSGIIAALISKYDNNLFCYCDIKDNDINAFAINISKKPKENSIKYKIKSNALEKKDNFEDYIKLFNNEINYLSANLYDIERI